MITVVTKPFDGPDGHFECGTIVDSSTWRNEGRLVNCRFLRSATEDEAKSFKAPRAKPAEPKAPAAKPGATKTAAAAKAGTKKRAGAK